MNFRTLCATAAIGIGLIAAAAPAEAVDTNATFVITATGSLSVSAPASTVALGSVTEGSLTFAPTLGAVTVTDTRNALVSNWTMTATGTHFDLQGAGANPAGNADHRVLSSAVAYTGAASYTSGTGVLVSPTGLLSVGAVGTHVGSGNNTVTWNPTLTYTLRATQQNGTYAGTITHNVL